MWKKDEEQTTTTAAATTTRQSPRATMADGSRRAVIGPSISIKGDVTGSEDLLIEGEVDGSVSLGDHAVGVGSDGRVHADIVGRIITVDGQVEGNLQAQEQIVLRGTAKVRGDIKAPRVVLEDGATFRGLVDMGSPGKGSHAGAESTSANGRTEAASAKDDDSKSNGSPKADVKDSSSASKATGKGDSTKDASARSSATAK